ncbi:MULTISPECIES: chaperone NapD [unclassified Rhizobium]|uniref:chaperone NapD n=1 Tax=unclassified Rhizobium TaxID=2613769 RepID=UPI00071484D2|nr:MULTISPECIES: chaperone NapD [unclassified Rhizobium]KQS82393.1 glutamate synthase [Rhizobium sp. Leaf386]KQT02740.1 glutamate synthase [Rhizobium sp. Leaf391]KQU03459.1 glutamate synthase [Rhizobium sp. Leaf453]
MPDIRHHISSAIVMTRPEMAETISDRLSRIDGVEVHGSGSGKIVIVIEGPTAGHLGETLLGISAMEDVLGAHMVFEQAISDEEVSDDGRTHAA